MIITILRGFSAVRLVLKEIGYGKKHIVKERIQQKPKQNPFV